MKTIVLIRHAKSSWDQDLRDLDRPLSVRGITDANLISKEFKDFNYQPDAVYTSPANRAATTCGIFMENLSLPKDSLYIKEELYDFGGDQVRRFIKALNNDLKKIMIFGHNHAFTSLANSLGNAHIDNLPTSGIVMIDFDVEHWKDVKVGTTKMILIPKDFK